MWGRKKFAVWILMFLTSSAFSDDARRHLPQPLDSIYPQTEYTGSIVGLPYTNTNSQLNQAIWKMFPSLEQQDIYVYGWLSPSYNRTSTNITNLPLGFPFISNDLEFDQGVVVIEKKSEYCSNGNDGCRI